MSWIWHAGSKNNFVLIKTFCTLFWKPSCIYEYKSYNKDTNVLIYAYYGQKSNLLIKFIEYVFFGSYMSARGEDCLRI